ncbi:DNA-binding MarR family transcriptional regulator [Novosphingobium sp. PhB57]|uniref:MarR family winged helix-turn-helix transcriptional regulator n=1 Tax=Novosphingobium sp. PhB57 TaxID=2485107 RepID=UPI0010492642|nr:MarR family transcriptional regulator [Novosphingobium sp. PhB57]TCU57450.1 DNA-binding MarR family transcriptional regulator [Novosphingobium sp. PhB57]
MSIQQEVLEQMRDLHLRMHRLFNDRMRAHGASLAQLKLLLLMERCGAMRSTDIADALGQAPRTVTEAIDGLERDGLVARSPDPSDRRAKRINLTEAGRAVIREVEPHRDAFAAQFFEVLGFEDLNTFLSILRTLNDRMIEMGAPSTLDNGALDNRGSPEGSGRSGQ